MSRKEGTTITSNYGDTLVLVPLNKEIDGVTERLGVEQQRRDVLEHDPYTEMKQHIID